MINTNQLVPFTQQSTREPAETWEETNVFLENHKWLLLSMYTFLSDVGNVERTVGLNPNAIVPGHLPFYYEPFHSRIEQYISAQVITTGSQTMRQYLVNDPTGYYGHDYSMFNRILGYDPHHCLLKRNPNRFLMLAIQDDRTSNGTPVWVEFGPQMAGSGLAALKSLLCMYQQVGGMGRKILYEHIKKYYDSTIGSQFGMMPDENDSVQDECARFATFLFRYLIPYMNKIRNVDLCPPIKISDILL